MKTNRIRKFPGKSIMSILSIVVIVAMTVSFVMAEIDEGFSNVSTRGIVPQRIAGNDSGGAGELDTDAEEEAKFFDPGSADPGEYYFPSGSDATNFKIRFELALHAETEQVYMTTWEASPDTLILHIASKGGDFYNLYDYEDIQFDPEEDRIFDDGNIWSPFNESGNTNDEPKVYGISHITFYYNVITPEETDETTTDETTTDETTTDETTTDETTTEETTDTDTLITIATETIPLASVTTSMNVITVTTPQVPQASGETLPTTQIEMQQIPQTGERGNSALMYTGLVLLLTAGGAVTAKKLIFRKQKTNK